MAQFNPMRALLLLLLPAILILTLAMSQAQDTPASLLESHLWEERVLLVMADTTDNAQYRQQRDILRTHPDGVQSRDLVIYDLVADTTARRDGRTLPHLSSNRFLAHLGSEGHDFTVTLIGKDGTEKHRQHEALSADTLFNLIDAMPMRQQEMQ